MKINNYFILFVFVFFIYTSCESVALIPLDINIEIQRDGYEEVREPYEEQKQWFEFLCSDNLGGRYSGSPGIKKAADFISTVINDDSLVRSSFEENGVMMENLIYRIKGNSDSTVVLGAHYDAYGFINKSPLPGADDNASGIVVLLMVIKTIRDEKLALPYSLTFCFFDGEEIGRYGSKQFVHDNKDPIKLYINVDTCGSENDYNLTVSYNSSFPELRDKFVTFPDGIGALPIMEYAPLGYITDCQYFAQNNNPFIAIGPDRVPYYLHSTNDNVSHISFQRLDLISKELVLFVSNYQ